MPHLLYTCITQKFDSLPHPCINSNGFDYRVFSDVNMDHLPDGWQCVKIDTSKGAETTAREYKFFPPQTLWEKYPVSIWINGNIHIKCDLQRLVKDVLGSADMAVLSQSPNFKGNGVIIRRHTEPVREACRQIFELNSSDISEICKSQKIDVNFLNNEEFRKHFGVIAHLPRQTASAKPFNQVAAAGVSDSSTPVNFLKHAKNCAVKIEGVICVGAHYGEEFTDFINAGATKILFIEPSAASFKVLKDRFEGNPHVTLLHAAMGDKPGKAVLNISSGNNGQSSSLLQPEKHLQEHPEIKFTATEEVEVMTLDSLPLNLADYNMLYMDAQGYEGKILKGAKNTLQNMDMVYTEVNRAEVYKGCAKVQQIDKLLQNFERIDTQWLSKSWGDALYIRKRNMVAVPEKFRPHIKMEYPPGNKLIFEEWFFKQQTWKNLQGGRTYLPVFWTSYYVNNNYGKNQSAIDELQQYINTLPTDKKYYTIVQYDDGILNNLSKLDIQVFSMNANETEFPLPLIGEHLPDEPVYSAGERKYLANFIGRGDTHPLRQQMLQVVKDLPGYYVSTINHGTGMYRTFLEQSTFTLCPRGYGKTSFRIAEALAAGSIPVYISDEFILPFQHDFNDYGLVVQPADIANLDKLLKAVKPEEINRLRQAGKEIYRRFTYTGCEKTIIAMLAAEILSQPVTITIKNTNPEIVTHVIGDPAGLIKSKKSKIASGAEKRHRNDGKPKTDTRKISLCLTNYNRTDLLFETLEYPLTDKRISEIIISDDCSDEKLFKKVKSFCKAHKKIKLLRNKQNVGMQQNKALAVAAAKNKWVILFDSDNVMDKTFVDSIYNNTWQKHLIYCPDFAQPQFNYTEFAGQTIGAEQAKKLLEKSMFRCLLNTCNYFVNRDEYTDKYVYNKEVKGSDSVWFVYQWLKSGNSLFIVPGMRYQHRVHDGSGFKADLDYNMKMAEETLGMIKKIDG